MLDMEGCDTNSSPLRAVVLSRDPLVGVRVERLCRRGWQAVRVASGFEAAAEILACPVGALLIDLRAMSDIHGRLLELAGRMKVQAFAIAGDAPSTMGQLPRVELEDIPAVLASLAAEEAPEAQPQATEEPLDTPSDVGLYESTTAPPAQTPTESPATIPQADLDEPPPAPAGEKRVTLTPKATTPKTRQVLLTAEELASLLEDEQ